MAKLPSFQFYPGDWMKDPAVRGCTLAARGLWFDMLCLMFESSRRGYLQHPTGKPVTAEQLARMTGCSASEAGRLLKELEEASVFSRGEDDVIYSRRMIRDEVKRGAARDAGKRGGNPILKGEDKGGVNPPLKGEDKPNLTPSSSSSSSLTPSECSAEPEPAAREENQPPNGKPPKAVPDSPHHRSIEAFCERWGAKYGEKYPFDRGKDPAAVKTLLAKVQGDESKFAAVVDRYLADSDPWVADKHHPLGLLLSQLPKWLVGEAARAPPTIKRAADNPLVNAQPAAPMTFPTRPPHDRAP